MKQIHIIKSIAVIVILSLNASLSYAQYTGPVRIQIASPKIKAVNNTDNIKALLEADMVSALAAQSDYVRLVERNYFGKIEKARKSLAKANDSDLKANALEGAQYILKSKITKFDIKKDSAKVKRYSGDKSYNLYVTAYTVSANIDFELVDVETGEVKEQYNLQPTGIGWDSDKVRVKVDRYKARREAISELRKCFRASIPYMTMYLAQSYTPVVKISKVKKNKAKAIFVKGGNRAPLLLGSKFEIVKSYNQDIGGKKVARQEKIGEAKFDTRYEEYGECKVKKGGDVIYQELEKGTMLLARPVELKAYDSCVYFLPRGYTSSRKTKLKSALSDAEDPKKKKASEDSSSKKSTKKVERKSGG